MKYILPIVFICLLQIMHAQDTASVLLPVTNQPKPLKEKIYYGGGIGLSFGSVTTIGIYPLIGFKIIPKLSVGVKLAYEYIQDNRYTSTYTTSNYGGSVFLRYRIIKPIYVHAEYTMLNYELYNELGESTREWIPLLLLGAGYSQSVGRNLWLNAQILFDVLQSSKSPYNNWEPFYSIGISAGF